MNERVYDRVNNGVYRAGFATTQEAYEEAWHALFDELDALEDRLSRRRYLCGDRVTEADWRLFATLVRFDAVYYSHFKCNRQRLVDYANLWGYTRSGDGFRTDADPEHVGKVALAAGVPLVELRTADGAGLEDMFLELTADTSREGAAA